MNTLDIGSTVVAAITLALFVTALYAKGLSHDLLLESGVFLVSVKLMIMMHKNEVVAEKLDEKLDAITAALIKKP
jgi:hypothetical protein